MLARPSAAHGGRKMTGCLERQQGCSFLGGKATSRGGRKMTSLGLPASFVLLVLAAGMLFPGALGARTEASSLSREEELPAGEQDVVTVEQLAAKVGKLEQLLRESVGTIGERVGRLEGGLGRLEATCSRLEEEAGRSQAAAAWWEFDAVRAELGRLSEKTEQTEQNMQKVAGDATQLRTSTAKLEGQVDALQAECTEAAAQLSVLTGRRRVQTGGQQPAGDAETARIFKRTFSSSGHQSGRVDESNGGRRRLTPTAGKRRRAQSGKKGTCPAAAELQSKCGSAVAAGVGNCDVCVTMHFKTCTDDDAIDAFCSGSGGSGGSGPDGGGGGGGGTEAGGGDQVSFSSMVAQLFKATCPPGLPADDCIPMCEAETNGFLLLLNLDGEDTKLTCELHHGLYSWVGGAADGGFIGTDPAALFSAVVSGAAGTYAGTLAAAANISTTLTVHRGQLVQIGGDQTLPEPPEWGTGGFDVMEGGSLALVYVAFLAREGGAAADGGEAAAAATLTVRAGGTLSVAASLLLPPLSSCRAVSRYGGGCGCGCGGSSSSGGGGGGGISARG